MWIINKILNKSKHKCVFCGDNHSRTEKRLVTAYTDTGTCKVWSCHTCAVLRGLIKE